MNSLDPAWLSARLVDVLNGGDPQPIATACAPGITVFATIVEEVLDPFARRDLTCLTSFVKAWHEAMPDIRFVADGIDTAGGAIVVRWRARGTHQKPIGYVQAKGRPITLSGVCAFRLAGDHISEIRLATDVYDFLLQTETICADPAVVRGAAREQNGAAMAWLQRAVATRRDELAAPVDAATVLHAAVHFYASSAFDQQSFELHGAGQFGRLFALLREQFASAELSVDDGVSQGNTTTFRGHAVVERHGERYSYLLRCGFRTGRDRVAESWFEINVPPTLLEVFA